MTSLYRKWRSQSFDDLVGQDHVVRTLRNAVRTGRVAHAYLFTGPRGTGKTSMARILAKAVNCTDPRDGAPCTVCEACAAAQEGRALDVIEIDAASNTGVDNVRDLRERAAYAAGEGRYKVYIVDEVHRLSGAAFDAFLKTLEEPPAHVIFVFASTEPHKVPATIMSRCQRFDFRRIAPEDSIGRLRYVVSQEGLTVSEDALALIALGAGGSLRDALGLLDQVISSADGAIEAEDVRRMLGLADPTLVSRLSDALIAGDTGAGLTEAAAHFAAGGDPAALLAQLTGYWRALLLASARAEGVPTDLDPGLANSVERHAAVLDEQRILGALRALTEREFSSKYNLIGSLPFEVGFISASLAVQNRAGPVVTATPATPTPNPSQPSEARTTSLPPPAKDHEVTETVAAAHQVTETAVAQSTPPGNGTPSSPPTVPPGASSGVVGSDVDAAWNGVLERMRERSRSLQAVLRSGYLMKVEGGEVVIAFLFDFHRDQFADVAKRRMLEEVIAEVLGSTYRVQVVKASKAEIEAARGAGSIFEDDGFIAEATERLRQMHARQISNGGT